MTAAISNMHSRLESGCGVPADFNDLPTQVHQSEFMRTMVPVAASTMSFGTQIGQMNKLA